MVLVVFVTDAWYPQVNGVVRTIRNLSESLKSSNFEVTIVHPGVFYWTVPCPFYPEITFAISIWQVPSILSNCNPDCLHIFTEGPIGVAARIWAENKGLPFTTSYHTRFPEFLECYCFTPQAAVYRFLYWFHRPSRGILVPTPSVEREMAAAFAGLEEDSTKSVKGSILSSLSNSLLLFTGFEQSYHHPWPFVVWTRGVDRSQFYPELRNARTVPHYLQGERPVILCVSRLGIEKNVEAFCQLELTGDLKRHVKVVVGDGPMLSRLKNSYPEIIFTGVLHGEKLAVHYAKADVFVFPSLLDTFGNVMIEAMSCGTPVAAFPVTGPIDVVENGVTGYLNTNLTKAVNDCLSLDRSLVTKAALQKWTIERCAKIFIENLAKCKAAEKNGRESLAIEIIDSLLLLGSLVRVFTYVIVTISFSYINRHFQTE